MVHVFNPNAQEAEAGGSIWIQSQPGLQSEFQERLQSYTKNPVLKKEKEWPENIPIINLYKIHT